MNNRLLRMFGNQLFGIISRLRKPIPFQVEIAQDIQKVGMVRINLLALLKSRPGSLKNESDQLSV